MKKTEFKGAAAKPWKVTWATGSDGLIRPQILDANGAVMAEVKIGYGSTFARKLAGHFVESQKTWRS